LSFEAKAMENRVNQEMDNLSTCYLCAGGYRYGVTVGITNDAVPPDRLQVSINGYNLDALLRTYSFTTKPVEAFPYVGRWTPGDTE
jgi:hypothetical protein